MTVWDGRVRLTLSKHRPLRPCNCCFSHLIQKEVTRSVLLSQGWHSGWTARLPPMGPGLESYTWRVILPPQINKLKMLNASSIREQRTKNLPAECATTNSYLLLFFSFFLSFFLLSLNRPQIYFLTAFQ